MSKLAIETEDHLESLLSEPTDAVTEVLSRLQGDLILLGIAGKMGPTMARMAKRASDAAGVQRRVIGVSRFSTGGWEALRAHGVETICCDLRNGQDVARLPDAANVVFLAGRKFGSAGEEAATWAMNCYVPTLICRKYRGSRVVAFSKGNVYGLVPVEGGGSREGDGLRAEGEYAMSCLGRERLFEYLSRGFGTQMALIRLNYACELRYRVLVDLAHRIQAGRAIDLCMGYLNTIWQGGANAMALRAFAHVAALPRVLSVTAPELLSVRDVCERLGRLMKMPVRFTGTESTTSLLSDARCAQHLMGCPRVSADQLIE